MKAVTVGLVILSYFVALVLAEEDGTCRLVDDYHKKNLHESICYLECLSAALNKLYTEGEKRLFVNEQVYANASRILDDMEGKTGESSKYLSVISGVMGEEKKDVEKLISYGNEMGDFVAKVGGLFIEVNESVRAVRNALPTALLTANKYYTAITEITRTVWDDVKALESNGDQSECNGERFKGVKEFQVTCGDNTCPLRENVNESTLQEYKDGCLDITVQSGSVSQCLNLPRNNLYKNGAVNESKDGTNWYSTRDHYFQIKVEVKNIFGPLITPFTSGQPPSVLLQMMSNITLLSSHFEEVHSNFTSLLLDIGVAGSVNNTNSVI